MPNRTSDMHQQLAGQPAHPVRAAPGRLHRELRPLRVVLLNGAEQKSDGDLRIARLLGNTAHQLELAILRDQHAAERDISPHLLHFYRTFAEVQSRTYDALVVIGYDAQEPRRSGPCGDDELAAVIAWSCQQGHAGLVLGGAAIAVLGLRYGLVARRLKERRSGIVRHRLVAAQAPLLRGHDRAVWVPVAGARGLDGSDLPPGGALESLVESAQAGIHLLHHAARRLTFVLNDISADADAFAQRLKDADHGQLPHLGAARAWHGWQSHAQLLVANWLVSEVGRDPAPPPFEHAGDIPAAAAFGPG